MKYSSPLILVSLILSSCTTPKPESEIDTIRNAFADWKQEVIKKGIYLDSVSCNPGYIAMNIDQPGQLAAMGIPDSSKILYLYADLNKDKKLDGMAIFRPILCHATVPVTGPQRKVILLSGPKEYTANDTFFKSIKSDTIAYSYGNLEILGMSGNNFFGYCDVRINMKYEQDERTGARTRKMPFLISWPGGELRLLDDEPSNPGAVIHER